MRSAAPIRRRTRLGCRWAGRASSALRCG